MSIFDELESMGQKLDQEIADLERDRELLDEKLLRLKRFRRALWSEKAVKKVQTSESAPKVITRLKPTHERIIAFFIEHPNETYGGKDVSILTGSPNTDVYRAMAELREIGFLARAGVQKTKGQPKRLFQLLNPSAVDHLRSNNASQK